MASKKVEKFVDVFNLTLIFNHLTFFIQELIYFIFK